MIKTNAGEFNLNLSKAIAKAKEGRTALVRKVAIDLNTKVVDKTPRDTGAAKNRWALALKTPDQTEYGPDLSGAGSIARAIKGIAAFVPGDTIFVTNNLPYIRMLEYGLYGKPEGTANGPKTKNGFSIQAPSGFARITFKEIKAEFNKKIKEIG
jgi:hypothetical protein